jgi:hypothetical protein
MLEDVQIALLLYKVQSLEQSIHVIILIGPVFKMHFHQHKGIWLALSLVLFFRRASLLVLNYSCEYAEALGIEEPADG